MNNGDIFRALTFRYWIFDAVVDDAHLSSNSHYDGVIDHYGRMMLNRLKMRSGMAVETYMYKHRGIGYPVNE